MSDDEYTPTTALVRDGYSPDDAAVRAQYIDGRAWISAISETRLALEFDRWLAAHDAEISFVAWGEGHSQALSNVAWPKERKGNPYQKAHTDE